MAIGEAAEAVGCHQPKSVSPQPYLNPNVQQQTLLQPSQMDSLSLRGYLSPVPRLSAVCDKTANSLQSKEVASSTSHSSTLLATEIDTTSPAGNLVAGMRPQDRIEALLKEKPAIKVIEMGFPEEIVKEVIFLDTAKTGGSYVRTEDLLDAVFAYQQSMDLTESIEKNRNLNVHVSTVNAVDKKKDSKENSNLSNLLQVEELKQEEKPTISKKKKSKGSKQNGMSSQTLIDKTQSKKIGENMKNVNANEANEPDGNSDASDSWQGLSSLDLKDENKKMKSSRLCRICLEKEISVVLLPCGHLISCSDCISLIVNCTICHQAVKGSVKVFLA